MHVRAYDCAHTHAQYLLWATFVRACVRVCVCVCVCLWLHADAHMCIIFYRDVYLHTNFVRLWLPTRLYARILSVCVSNTSIFCLCICMHANVPASLFMYKINSVLMHMRHILFAAVEANV